MAGHFPEGAVLVKERFHTATQQMTPGTVSHAEQLVGWFVMVKESKNLHPENKLWGTAGPGPISTAPIHIKRSPPISKWTA
jgi:hypothetical protein